MYKIIYHGHSFVEIKIGNDNILIDPFISGNSLCDIKVNDVKCNYVILTHGHSDHFGDTIEIAKNNNATVIATFELAAYCDKKNLKTHHMNLGGSYEFPFGKVKLTLAHHSSSTVEGQYAGDPAGILLHSNDKTIYHAGDTSLFYDMKLIGEANKIDFAFLPIGDNFTMGIDDAVKAADFLNAKTVIPIHYNTFDSIKVDTKDFNKKIESIGRKCIIMNAGDEINL